MFAICSDVSQVNEELRGEKKRCLDSVVHCRSIVEGSEKTGKQNYKSPWLILTRHQLWAQQGQWASPSGERSRSDSKLTEFTALGL